MAKQEELRAIGATIAILSSKNCFAREQRFWNAKPEPRYFAPDAAWVRWIEALAYSAARALMVK